MISRRRFLKGAGGMLCCGSALADNWGCSNSDTADYQQPSALARKKGCNRTGAIAMASSPRGAKYQLALEDGNIDLLVGSGSSNLDARLIVLARDITRFYNITGSNRPALFFFEDDELSPNSLQADQLGPGGSVLSGTRGTVVLGKHMVQKLLVSDQRLKLQGAALAGIVAHEFAHAYQHLNYAPDGNRKIFDALRETDCGTSALYELHADYLAGYYMAQMGINSERAASDFAEALHDLGDFGFNDPTHHGTPSERVECMNRGRNEMLNGNTSVDKAAAVGYDFVVKLTLQRS